MRRDRQRPTTLPAHKYQPYAPLGLPDRTWPDQRISAAPQWCSVDLRDGNQSLLDPMDPDRKRQMFELLVRLGFKEIEVGFPASSRADWDFIRDLAERDAIPDDVTIQVLSPMRTELIEQSVSCLEGIPRTILQVYNPISVAQRRAVFRASRAETKQLALDGAECSLRLRDKAAGTSTMALQYCAESFTQTEPDFALEICNAVLELWQPGADDDVRMNLPATVEAFPPHEFADRVEWIHRNLSYRDVITLSVHPHNDRGTAVAATEAAVLAGADRVEGTLFGSGERTGNVCLVTLAVNLLSQGVDPMLDLSDIDEIRRITELCNRMPVSARHPWAGDFVYTSFAGSHQDAISKGLQERVSTPDAPWDVPYLPVDPRDLGRDYKALIRISNQSGKGGIAYLMREFHGLDLPRRCQIEFSSVVQEYLDLRGGEVTPALLWSLFEQCYLTPGPAADLSGGPAGEPEQALDELAARLGIPVSVRDLSYQAAVGTADGRSAGRGADRHACYAEVAVGTAVRWGAGLETGATEAKLNALAVAFSRAAGQRGAALVDCALPPDTAGARP